MEQKILQIICKGKWNNMTSLTNSQQLFLLSQTNLKLNYSLLLTW